MGREAGSSSTSATRCTPTTCSPSRAASRCRRPRASRLPVLVGREGHVLVEAHGSAARPATARSRSAPTTRSSPRPRSCAASTRTSPQTQIHDVVAPVRRGHGLPGRDHATRSSTPTGSTRRSPSCRSGCRALVHACTHTTFAPNVDARRHEDERHPRRASSSRSTSARCPARRATSVRAMLARGARRPRRPGRDRVERRPVDRVADRHAAVGLAVPRHAAGSSKDSALVPFLMVGGTDNRFFRRAGSVGYGFGAVQPAALVRGLRHDVPRQRRARRRRVARPLGAALGSRRPRPARVHDPRRRHSPRSSIASLAAASDRRNERAQRAAERCSHEPGDELDRDRPLDRRDDACRRRRSSRRTPASTSSSMPGLHAARHGAARRIVLEVLAARVDGSPRRLPDRVLDPAAARRRAPRRW